MTMVSFNDLMKSGMFDEEFRLQYGDLFQYDRHNRYVWAVKTLEVDAQTPTPLLSEIIIEQMSLARLELQNFFNFLWIVKDNNVSVCNQYGFVKGRKETYISNSDRTDFCSDGNLYDCGFDDKEIALSKQIYEKYLSESKNHVVNLDTIKQLKKRGEQIHTLGAIAGQISLVHYDQYSRIERAEMFLGGARTVEFLPNRIAMYMQAFEALFATEPEGVNFKVPLRVAHYLGNDKDSKQLIFKTLQEGYNVRSRYLHGDRINKTNKIKIKMEDLPPISYNVDDILRRAMTKIILDDIHTFLLPTEDNYDTGVAGLRTYFNNLIF